MTKLNWERSRQTNRQMDTYQKLSYARTLEIEYGRPTAKQKKYLRYLCMRCKEEGLTPKVMRHLKTRAEYHRAITDLCEQLGIEDKKPDTFEAFGDFVAVREDKVQHKCKNQKYECPECYHRFKSKNMYPCDRCRDKSHFKEGDVQ